MENTQRIEYIAPEYTELNTKDPIENAIFEAGDKAHAFRTMIEIIDRLIQEKPEIADQEVGTINADFDEIMTRSKGILAKQYAGTWFQLQEIAKELKAQTATKLQNVVKVLDLEYREALEMGRIEGLKQAKSLGNNNDKTSTQDTKNQVAKIVNIHEH